jgi:hypothetical protein
MPIVTDEQLTEIAEKFKALSEPSRLAVLRRLMEGEAAVGEIAEDMICDPVVVKLCELMCGAPKRPRRR